MVFKQARVTSIAEVRFMAILSSQDDRVIHSRGVDGEGNVPRTAIPALLTNTEIGEPIEVTRLSTSSGFDRLKTKPLHSHSQPAAFSSSTRSKMRALVLQIASLNLPDRLKRVAIAKPIPLGDPHPVTNAKGNCGEEDMREALKVNLSPNQHLSATATLQLR